MMMPLNMMMSSLNDHLFIKGGFGRLAELMMALDPGPLTPAAGRPLTPASGSIGSSWDLSMVMSLKKPHRCWMCVDMGNLLEGKGSKLNI